MMNNVNLTRRIALRTLCITAIAGLLPSFVRALPIAEKRTAAVTWEIPTLYQMIVYLDEAHDFSGVWAGRYAWVSEVVWTALEVTARHNENVVKKEMFEEMLDLKNLEQFGLQYQDTDEGKLVNRYVNALPSYAKGQELTQKTLESHGYLTMMVIRAVEDISRKAA